MIYQKLTIGSRKSMTRWKISLGDKDGI